MCAQLRRVSWLKSRVSSLHTGLQSAPSNQRCFAEAVPEERQVDIEREVHDLVGRVATGRAELMSEAAPDPRGAQCHWRLIRRTRDIPSIPGSDNWHEVHHASFAAPQRTSRKDHPAPKEIYSQDNPLDGCAPRCPPLEASRFDGVRSEPALLHMATQNRIVIDPTICHGTLVMAVALARHGRERPPRQRHDDGRSAARAVR
jgi:hypothetical protein